MDNDIVARLRAVLHNDRSVELMNREAANEIERLRLELSIPRDEYAMTWKALLDRIEDLDLVEWIRAYANAYNPSDYNSPIAREVIARSDKKWMEAADEIERLRAERDAARLEVCMLRAPSTCVESSLSALAGYADSRGWDCCKESDQ